jgi:phosphoesterase RecJ-like protein
MRMPGRILPSEGPGLTEAESIKRLIAAAGHTLLVTHVAPDGDAVGSLLGLGWLLRAQGKDLTMLCEDPVPEIYSWLPGSAEIVQFSSRPYDLVISLDCSDQRRMGKVAAGDLCSSPLINIDHHVTNTLFGSLNWVDPSSVATAQMILTLAKVMGWELTERVGLCLLTGLVTDTRSFRTPNVDASALRAALCLMQTGASLPEVTQRVLQQRPLASVLLWGQAIGRLQLEDGILWTEVTSAMRQRWGSGQDGESGLANFLSGVREADVVVVFTERDNGEIDVGMRAAPGQDVAQVALSLGGGGHPQAAGCTMVGALREVRGQVLTALRCSLQEQRIAAA